VKALDSYRDEIVLRVAEFLLRQARRAGHPAALAALWPPELRDLAHERGWLTGPSPHPGALEAGRAELIAERGQHAVLARLAVRLGLDEPAIRLLACCAVAQLDPSLLRLWYLLRPSPTITGYSLGTWLELFPDDRAALYRALAPDAPLRRLHLLDVRSNGPSLLTADVEVPHRVIAALLGHDAALDELPPGAITVRSTLTAGELVLPAGDSPEGARVAFIGVAGAGRTSQARLWANAHAEAAVVVDIARVPPEAAAIAVALALREAVLRDATPVIRLDTLKLDHAPRVLAELDRHEAAFAVVAPPALSGVLLEYIAGLELIEVARMPLADQRRLWQLELARKQIAAPALPAQIVAAYDMLPGNIAEVARRLRSGAEVNLGTIRDLVRGTTTTELWGLAGRVTTSLTWSDVILPETTHDLVRELLAHARHRVTVFEDWGYGRKINYGLALTALFYGPPGTGKTLTASLIANDLGRDLFRVDLSRIIDKYVGETEKNLERIFTAAARSHAMLLFDEADSLFARRTGVESANDRYANLAVNYLLQALEAFEGICVLTTNMDSSIDEAFRRRMRFRIEFPKPSVAEQAALWQTMITPEARVDPDIPWAAVAEEFPEMTGGHIRSAVLRAAFLAVAEEGIIDHARIRRAARAEYEELGHIVAAVRRTSL
jgi:AAA+ superfamily predicted ATPase